MALDPKDLELIERLIYKNADDTAVAIARSFERIEERIDSTESRIYGKLGELAGDIESYRQDIAEKVDEIALRV